MREKYLNMSGLGFEMEELKPVDILNLTFEHNKKKQILTSKRSSSSESHKNEANILEDMKQKPYYRDDSDRTPSIHMSQSRHNHSMRQSR